MVNRLDLDAAFGALVDPRRRQVLELLSTGPLRAGELARRAGMAPPAMSRHLRTLLESGLVEDERGTDARQRLFRLRAEPLQQIEAWAARTSAGWEARLGAFKRHVEKRPRQRQ